MSLASESCTCEASILPLVSTPAWSRWLIFINPMTSLLLSPKSHRSSFLFLLAYILSILDPEGRWSSCFSSPKPYTCHQPWHPLDLCLPVSVVQILRLLIAGTGSWAECLSCSLTGVRISRSRQGEPLTSEWPPHLHLDCFGSHCRLSSSLWTLLDCDPEVSLLGLFFLCVSPLMTHTCHKSLLVFRVSDTTLVSEMEKKTVIHQNESHCASAAPS